MWVNENLLNAKRYYSIDDAVQAHIDGLLIVVYSRFGWRQNGNRCSFLPSCEYAVLDVDLEEQTVKILPIPRKGDTRSETPIETTLQSLESVLRTGAIYGGELCSK